MLNKIQRDTLTLWYQVNASLSAYDKLIKAFSSAENAVDASTGEWQQLKIHNKHIQRHREKDKTTEFLDKIDIALNQQQYQIIFAQQAEFPAQLNELFDPPPLLFVRGNQQQLQQAQIAIVGSRKPSPHAQKITFDIAQYLAGSGYIITSGLAQGVDYQAHIGALTQNNDLLKGRTVGVMGTGIDVCYPRHHNQLFSKIIEDGGCIISELLPATPANKHTFPRRNRIVAGLSLGTIVTEAMIKSGSLITARLTSEQGKQVFAVPSHIDNKNAEGCHHLIREGATLIYHPDQVLQDLRFQQQQPTIQPTTSKPTQLITNNLTTATSSDLPTSIPTESSINPVKQPANKQSANKPSLPLPNTDLPDHLTTMFALIDWNGVDVDSLVNNLKIDTQIILGQLMELELLGLVMQQGGRYVRV